MHITKVGDSLKESSGLANASGDVDRAQEVERVSASEVSFSRSMRNPFCISLYPEHSRGRVLLLNTSWNMTSSLAEQIGWSKERLCLCQIYSFT